MALIGASGSGKSTILRCIDLLEEIDDGDIFLDGEVITDPSVDPVAVRRRLGLVFQAYNLFPHLNALENVVLGIDPGHGVERSEAEESARALLARFGLEGREHEDPDRLSGGQQQRVAIARAFATRPRAMLLDEVTSALDPELVGEVLEAVRDLKARGSDDGPRHPRDGLRPRGRRRRRASCTRAGWWRWARPSRCSRTRARRRPSASCGGCCRRDAPSSIELGPVVRRAPERSGEGGNGPQPRPLYPLRGAGDEAPRQQQVVDRQQVLKAAAKLAVGLYLPRWANANSVSKKPWTPPIVSGRGSGESISWRTLIRSGPAFHGWP